MLAVTLPSVAERVRHRIDYLGTGLLAAGLSAIVLLTSCRNGDRGSYDERPRHVLSKT